MQGYQALCLLDGRHSTQKENTLNKCSKQGFNYFTRYSGTDTQGSQEFISNFSFRQFDMAQILNDCTCVTKKPFLVLYQVITCQNPASDHLFLSQGILPVAST